MESDQDRGNGKVPLPRWREQAGAPQAAALASTRVDGIRHLRRMSAWSAAALIVGTSAAAAALAHGYAPASQPAGAQVPGGAATSAASPGAAASHRGSGPAVTHSVATTSGSGVTTTTTRTAAGKTIVTRVRHAGSDHDN